MSRGHGALPPPLWGRVGERGSRGGRVAVVSGLRTPPSLLRESPRVAPPSLTLPHKGGGNGYKLPRGLQAMDAQR
jgi:hypothetical protein